MVFLVIVIVIYECEFGSWMCLCVFGNGSAYLNFGGEYLVFGGEVFVIGFVYLLLGILYVFCVSNLLGGFVLCFVFCGCVFGI